jgi:hypothetical protein
MVMTRTTNRTVTDGDMTACRVVLVVLTMAMAAVADVHGAIPTALASDRTSFWLAG